MKTLLPSLLILVAVAFTSCTEELKYPTNCSTHAIVEDWTDLDGCGYLLRLDNGEYLEPIRVGWCETPPVSERPADPLDNITFEDGMHVMIDYEAREDWGSICMKGTPVFISCIEEVEVQVGDL